MPTNKPSTPGLKANSEERNASRRAKYLRYGHCGLCIYNCDLIELVSSNIDEERKKARERAGR